VVLEAGDIICRVILFIYHCAGLHHHHIPLCAVQDFLTQSSGLSPEERARVLEADDDICRGHDDAAQEGQTAAPPRDESIDYHFIAFVQVTQRCQPRRNFGSLIQKGPKKNFFWSKFSGMSRRKPTLLV
jgi:hypothetical protein